MTEPWDPTGGAWVRAILPDIMAQQAASEAHAVTCADRPCERCERFVCRCGAPVDGRRECLPCAEADARAWQLRPTHMSVPPRFRRWLGADAAKLRAINPDTGRPYVALAEDRIAKALAAPPTRSLLLTGTTAVGKTSLAVAMLDAAVRLDPSRRRGAIFVEAAWLARARARHRLGHGESDLVETAIAAPLLLLDDLGQEREDRDGCITDVVYSRSNADLPTWVTSGLPGDLTGLAAHLSQRYDGGFVRRILESGARVELGR